MAAGKHVLVVEDCAATRAALRLLLEAECYRVTCAANGREALDYLHEGDPPFLILLDLSMPVMDGWQFRQEQRRDPTLAPIPALLLSAENDLPRIAASLGAAAYLPKPVNCDNLLETLCLWGQERPLPEP